MHAVREHRLSVGGLAALEGTLETRRRDLLHEVGARERPRRRPAVVVQEREALAREAAPVPAQIAEVQVGEVDEVGSANTSEGSSERKKVSCRRSRRRVG